MLFLGGLQLLATLFYGTATGVSVTKLLVCDKTARRASQKLFLRQRRQRCLEFFVRVQHVGYRAAAAAADDDAAAACRRRRSASANPEKGPGVLHVS
jgi:hypothetical protein